MLPQKKKSLPLFRLSKEPSWTINFSVEPRKVANQKCSPGSLENEFHFDLTLPMLVLSNKVLEP